MYANGVRWKEFKIGDLFEPLRVGYIGTGKKIGSATKEPDAEHCIPLTCAKIGDNGIMYWGKRGDFITYTNALSVIADGAVSAGLVYAQPEEAGAYSHSYFIRVKDIDVSKYVNLFLSTVLTKVIYPKYSREDAPRWNKIENEMIFLPIKDDETPNWDYMAEQINKIETEQIKRLNEYLSLTGFDDYELTEADKQVLELKPQWKEFLMGDVFDIFKGKRLTKKDQISGNTLFIGATAVNHGQTARIGQEPLFPVNTITVAYNGSVGEAFYQEEPYWASDDINVLFLKNRDLNRYIASYLCAVIRKAGKLFYYNQKWNLERMKVTKISLPINSNNVPDWDYMERFIRVMEKLVIADVVKWRNQQIKVTKQVVDKTMA